MFKRAVILAAIVALVASYSFAAAKTYQVTGPVLAINGDVITVQKGSDKWEIEKSAATKITGDLKVGSKVTIEYRMTATSVEAKAEKAAPAPKKK